MKRILVVALVSLLSWSGTASAHGIKLAGDETKARQVWITFEAWLSSYSRSDLAGVMSIFDREIEFSFQGANDQSYGDMEKSYARDFATKKPGTAWVPTVEEVYAGSHMAIVRAVWELRTQGPGGKTVIGARNRSMDVLRLSKDGKWHIFRSINYPEKADQKGG